MKKAEMQRVLKSVLAIFVVILLVLSTVMYSFAAEMFTDVKSNHWAKPYIDKMVSKNIIKGYEDHTFKPDASVSRIESIVMISRLYDENEVNSVYKNNKTKYEADFKKYNVPTWAYPQLVFALEKGIMNKSLIPELVKNGKNQDALRIEIAIALTKALDLTDEMDKNAKLTFKDANQIPKEVVPYIDILIKKGVINGKGDWQGNFNPNTPVTRAEMSKMLSVSYDLKQKDTNNNNNNNNNNNTIDVLTLEEGTIYDVDADSNNISITIKNSKGEKKTYSNKTPNVSIKWGNDKVDASSLKDDMKVMLTVNGSVLQSVKITEADVEKEGYFYSVSYNNNGSTYAKFKVDGDYEEYKFDNTVDVTINGKNSSLYNAKKDDKAKFTVSNNKLEDVEITSKEREVKGIVKKVSSSEITITTDKKDYTYDIDSKVKVERDNDKCEIKDVRVGDEVELELEYDKAVKVDAEPVSHTEYGELKEIKIAQDPQIVVKLKDSNDLVTYNLESGFTVERDDDTIGLFDISIGSQLKIRLESDRVTKIEDLSSSGSYKVSGKIISRDRSNNTFEIKQDGTGKTIYIKYNSSTKAYDDGISIKPDNLDEDDEVMVVGDNKIGTVEAKKIYVVE